MRDRQDKTVYMKADARAKHGNGKVSLDAIRSANATNIALFTETSHR
jgi:biopolymer transport protein ExbD